MDFQAKAKPIHFRIVSGGVECSSLDDLRRNFDIKSIASAINDGRLVKWLTYIKESNIAKEIDAFKGKDLTNDDEQLKVISVFTGKQYDRKKFKREVDFIRELDCDGFTVGIVRNRIVRFQKEDLDVLLYAYHNHINLIPNTRTYFGTFLGTENPEVLWVYGKSTCENDNINDIKKGLVYIEKAASLGFAEAKKYVESQEYINKKRKLQSNIDDDRKKEISLKIIAGFGGSYESWIDNPTRSFHFFEEYSKYKSYTKEEKDIFRLCLNFSTYPKLINKSGIKQATNQKIDFGTAQKAYDFLCLYAREDEYGMLKATGKYRELSYMPATQRVNFGFNYIRTNHGVSIKMLWNPNFNYYMRFVYDFLTNILYF